MRCVRPNVKGHSHFADLRMYMLSVPENGAIFEVVCAQPMRCDWLVGLVQGMLENHSNKGLYFLGRFDILMKQNYCDTAESLYPKRISVQLVSK